MRLLDLLTSVILAITIFHSQDYVKASPLPFDTDLTGYDEHMGMSPSLLTPQSI